MVQAISKSPLEKIEVDSIQKKIIEDFTEIISEEIDLSKMAIKGFLWKFLREWQKAHGMTHSDTEKNATSSPADRIQQIKEIFAIFKSQVTFSTDIDHKTLDVGLKKSLHHNELLYANR